MKEPVWIRQDVVLAMHEEARKLHGGPEGVRDRGTARAVVRAQQGPQVTPRPNHNLLYLVASSK